MLQKSKKSGIIYIEYLCIKGILPLFIQYYRKARFVMSNGYTNLTPNISVESTAFFSAGFAAAKIAPVAAVVVSGMPDGKFGMALKIQCSHNNVKLFSFDKEYPVKDCRQYDFENAGRLIIAFDYSDFEVNYSALKELCNGFDTEIVTTLYIGTSAYEIRNPISILSVNEFAGIEAHPEHLAAFVSPSSEAVKALVSKGTRERSFTSYYDACEIASGIINSIRGMNIICTKRDGYSPEKRQSITPIDKMFGKSSVVATPLELALLFCSTVQCMGLDGVIAFVKNVMGVVSVYCGICIRKDISFAVNESITGIRRLLDDGEMLLIDPAVLSSAQNVDIEHASFLASEIMHKNGTDMLVAVGTGACNRDGVDFIYGGEMQKRRAKKDARAALGEIYSGLQAGKSFKLLSGDYGNHDIVPLVGFTSEMLEKAYGDKLAVRPMEISEKISDFRDISDGFAAFALKDVKKKEYNSKEMKEVQALYASFKNRILSKDCAVSGIYEKVFHERMSRMCYGSASGMRNYIISGFMRMTDKKTKETLYFPLSFTEIKLSNRYGYVFECSGTGIIANPVLSSFLDGNDDAFISADSAEKAFEYFTSLAEKTAKSGEYSDVSILKEYAIVKADLTDAVLWNDIRRNGKRMLADTSFAKLAAGEKAVSSEKAKTAFTLPRFVPSDLTDAILGDGHTVISGDSVKEKTDIAVNKAVASVAEGKKVLVSSANKDFNDEFYRELEKEGFGELMLRLDENMTSEELCLLMKNRVKEIAATVINPSSDILTDYDKLSKRIDEYSAALSVQDPVLGITVPEAVLSYFRACDAEDGTEIKVLNVKPEAFSGMTQHKFNVLFDRASKLVEAAEAALKAAGLSRSEPLKKHPLYPVAEKCSVNEESMSVLFDTVAKINGVVSDYRDTFYDISDYIGIDISDIKDINGLYALNELYKLVISARELEIPENATGKDITFFADGASKLKTDLGRAENIEYRLKFFGKEIFEDVDTLLSGYSPSEAGHGNFIKKFLVKKNNKDVLLQYVPDENRNEFNQHNVEEIYRLLEEYREIKASTSVTDTYLGKENSVKLADMIKAAEELLAVIYPKASENEKLMADKIGKICAFVRLVSLDAALSKKLTYARAKFAQVYSDNECLLGELSKSINADFTKLYFDSGILGYDGFGTYLKELERNLPALDVWNKYLEAKTLACEYMPEFAEYLEENGIKEHTDRVFAASLILPSVGYLIDKYEIIKHKNNCDGIKSRYFEMYNKAGALSSVNAVLSYKQRLKHYIETESFSNMENDIQLSLAAFVNKHKKAVLSVFPIVFADAFRLGLMFGGEAVSDVFIAGAFESSENLLVSGCAVSNSVFLIKYTEKNGILSDMLAESGCRFAEASYSLYSHDRALGALIGKKTIYGYDSNMPHLSLVTVNGNMRRVTDGANPKEAQSCVAQAGEIYAKSGKSVGIFTLTHGQAAYTKHLLDLSCESDKHLAEAVENGLVKVFEPSAVCYESFDNVLVSLGAASDQNGNIGWSYGCGIRNKAVPALVNAFNCVKERTVIVCSLTSKEITKLRKSSAEAEKLFLTVLSASKNITVMDASEDARDMSGLSYMMQSTEKSLVGASGRFLCEAEGYNTETGEFYMYDCDMQGNIKDRLYEAGLFGLSGTPFRCMSLLDNVLEHLGKN